MMIRTVLGFVKKVLLLTEQFDSRVRQLTGRSTVVSRPSCLLQVSVRD